jgi:hypothetical protein
MQLSIRLSVRNKIIQRLIVDKSPGLFRVNEHKKTAGNPGSFFVLPAGDLLRKYRPFLLNVVSQVAI